MAKIRGVKPEFWTDEDVCSVSIPARLLFIGMWNWACDNGHLQDKPKQIKRRVLPDDDVNATDLLRELDDADLIERADGWITIPNLTHHQKPDRRYFTGCDKDGCEVPERTVSQRAARRANTVRTSDAQGAHGVRTSDALGDGDGDGDGDGEKKKTSSSSGARKRGTRLTEDWRPSTETRDRMQSEHPAVDQSIEFWKFQDYWMAKAGKDATKIDWDRTYQNWIRTADERQPHRTNGHNRPDPALVLNETMPDLGEPTW